MRKTQNQNACSKHKPLITAFVCHETQSAKEHEYNIPINQEFREDVRIMCNLSTGIEERATEKTSEKFILNMYKKGYTLDQIADVAETGVDEVEAIIKKKEPAMA